MGDILSKEEKEALLKNETAENIDVEGKIVRPYDFHARERLSKEHLRMLQILAEDFCYRLKNNLSVQLRLEELEVGVVAIKQTTFKDFLSLPSPTYIAIFDMDPLEASAAMEVEPSFLVFLIEYLLGGKAEEKPQRRELTALETNVSSSLSKRILFSFKEAFGKAVKFETKIESVESNPQFVTIASPNEAALLISVEIKLKEVTGVLNICLPYLALEFFIPHLNIKKWFMHAQKKTSAESEEVIKKHLGNTKLNLVIEMGGCEVSLRDLYSLREGDYIRLDKFKNSLFDLKIGGLTKFKVQPGLNASRRIAVKLINTEV